ncbi:fibroblast growth factor 5 [Sphaerodactylus townsendi]|uniref:fibroblast growth factor 5 n=1 Tax=Sphaerodactylus townsendi TaxID=933632 RepID=UPI0020272636|nr:fibroblast growth factor 5 [Sphaerodactylus townsendi]
MSLSFLLCLLCLSHLILSAWARPALRAQFGDAALRAKNSSSGGGGGSSGGSRRPGNRSAASASSSSSAPSSYLAPAWGVQGSGAEGTSFQWSPSGRRTGSLYCRVGIGFHLQIHPDGRVNGSHQASILSKPLCPLSVTLHGEFGDLGACSEGGGFDPPLGSDALSVWDF